jgi:glutamine synthetase
MVTRRSWNAAGTRPEVPLVQLEVPDFELGLRGKVLRADKLAKLGRTAFCTILYGLDAVDDVTDIPLSSAANGFPDAFAVPDESTEVDLPWRPGTRAVVADLVHEDGRPLEESPRHILKRLVSRFEELGLEPVMGFEYEVYVVHSDDDVLRSRQYDRLRPVGRTINGYSLGRVFGIDELVDEFFARCEAIGAPLDAFHSEIGPGFFEFALSPAPALGAADRAARARQHFRDLCAEHGLLATFVAKLRMDASGSGGHLHQSLTRDGRNVFGDGSAGISDLARAYLGGLVATMADLTVAFNPNLNSFKRLQASWFVAERATWGMDNRNAACRVIANAGESAVRVEHRRPGADANPYIVAASALAGGLHGIQQGSDPGPALTDGADLATFGPPLPKDLAEAAAAFLASSVARSHLGDAFVDSYGATRLAEADAFTRWFRGRVTDWELARYLEAF